MHGSDDMLLLVLRKAPHNSVLGDMKIHGPGHVPLRGVAFLRSPLSPAGAVFAYGRMIRSSIDNEPGGH
jgi:hypothetical protein